MDAPAAHSDEQAASSSSAGQAVRDYHELTLHSPDQMFHVRDDARLLAGFRPMQPGRRPEPFKTYPGLPTEAVPDDLHDALFFSAGVVRYLEDPVLGTLYFRAAGSAGNLHPLEVYVLHEGRVFHYEPLPHALTPLGRAPDGPTTLVVTGVPWRTGWKYAERGYRHLYWDCGTMLAQVLALAPHARVFTGFVDAEVARLVGADGTHEFPLALVALDEGEPVVGPAGEAIPGGDLGTHVVEFPLVTVTQRAGDLSSRDDVAAWRANHAPSPAPVDLTFGEDVTDVIRRRGSTRRFDPTVEGPDRLLVDAFAAATSPLPADFVPSGGSLLEHNVLVHAIEGHEPGAYRWSGECFEQLRRADDTRAIGRHLCLDQELGGQGCYTAFQCAELDDVLDQLGPRGYRCAQLEAGVVEGRLHLSAFALGFGATGLTFYDTAVPRLFDTAAQPMLVTAVGSPAYHSKRGGEPGDPVRLTR